MATALSFAHQPRTTFLDRIRGLPYGLFFLLLGMAGISVALLYSAAGGDFDSWSQEQVWRYSLAFVVMLAIATTDIRIWLRSAYVIYFAAFVMLVAVELVGVGAGGAKRWISIGSFRLQPSEIMKIALLLALARYFHKMPFHTIGKPLRLVPPLLMILVPAALILKQPDLGTAGLLGIAGVAVLFLAGVRWWKFALVGGIAAIAIPFAWASLHGYQKQRFLAFLDPSSDPLGAGYHIIQSKIALGSGGLTGKGYLQGTQIHLNFLPEIHTDFIFSVLAEEFGLLGAAVLLILFALILANVILIGFRCKHTFGKLFATSFAFTIFIHIFVNLAMVSGLIPVVGVPLPLVSYGGTFLFALMIGFGFVGSVSRSRRESIGRHDEED